MGRYASKRAERTRANYAFEVDVDDFITLCRWLPKQDAGAPEYCVLGNALSQLGADEIEANGHFGAYIYFRLGTEDDTPEKHAAIAKTIDQFVRAALATPQQVKEGNRHG